MMATTNGWRSVSFLGQSNRGWLTSQASGLGCLLACLFVCSPVLGHAPGDRLQWLQRAEAGCQQIKDQASADRARFDINVELIKAGQLDRSIKIIDEIEDTELRGLAHIALAKEYASRSQSQLSGEQLAKARQQPVSYRLRNELVEAYLTTAKEPQSAIDYILQKQNNKRNREYVCQALARTGFIDEALELATQEKESADQQLLATRAAFAAASAGLVQDTEAAVAHPVFAKESNRSLQRIWCDLAKALYRDKNMDLAKEYAARVTDRYVIRTNRDLRRIKDDIPPGTPYLMKSAQSQEATVLKSSDPEVASRALAALVANVEANPIKPSSGQFGDWNQDGQLARVRLQHAIVAALYRKAGNSAEADRHLKLAQAAVKKVEEVNAFAGLMAISDVQRQLLSMDALATLKEVAQAANPQLFLWVAQLSVDKLLESGDVRGAQELAGRVLASEYAFGGSLFEDQNQLIAAFVKANELPVALQLVKQANTTKESARALHDAGKAMIEAGHRQALLSAPWQGELSAFRRTYLNLGAATGS